MALSEPNLQDSKFTTCRQGRAIELDYADIFVNNRVVIVSVPHVSTRQTFLHLDKFEKQFNTIKDLGINNLYCLSSYEPIVAPWAEKNFNNVIGLFDKNSIFLNEILKHKVLDVDIMELARQWEYIAVVNNGQLEKLISNFYKKNLALKVTRRPEYRYHGLAPDQLTTYLKDNKIS
jgi:peroxiredoxin